jgi:hypothetical protein
MINHDQRLRDLLTQSGFSFDRPDPQPAWAAFKRFAATPLPGLEPFAASYECFHVDDRDDVLWLSFMRRFDPVVSPFACGCLFSRPVPPELLSVNASDWWWPEHGTLPEWFSQVEQHRTFKLATALPGWRWEGFAD